MILDVHAEKAADMAEELASFPPEFRARVAVIVAAFGIIIGTERMRVLRELPPTATGREIFNALRQSPA